MRLSENPINRGMTKHIARRFHFIRQASENFKIALIPVKSENNIADAFTKPLPAALFKTHRSSMGVRNLAQHFAAAARNTIARVMFVSRHDPLLPTEVERGVTLWERKQPIWVPT